MPAYKSLKLFREHLLRFAQESEDPSYWFPRFKSPGFEVYLRRSGQAVRGDAYVCLEIADVVVFSQRKGTFKRLLAISMELCPWNAVKVECVQNQHLRTYLRHLLTEDDRWAEIKEVGSPSFIWIKDRNAEHTASYGGEMVKRSKLLPYLSQPLASSLL